MRVSALVQERKQALNAGLEREEAGERWRESGLTERHGEHKQCKGEKKTKNAKFTKVNLR